MGENPHWQQHIRTLCICVLRDFFFVFVELWTRLTVEIAYNQIDQCCDLFLWSLIFNVIYVVYIFNGISGEHRYMQTGLARIRSRDIYNIKVHVSHVQISMRNYRILIQSYIILYTYIMMRHISTRKSSSAFLSTNKKIIINTENFLYLPLYTACTYYSFIFVYHHIYIFFIYEIEAICTYIANNEKPQRHGYEYIWCLLSIDT